MDIAVPNSWGERGINIWGESGINSWGERGIMALLFFNNIFN
jgi:hypothetical protein